MSKTLSSSQVEHLLPTLPFLAGLVRDHGELKREDLHVFLVSKGTEEEWALAELFNWSRTLSSLLPRADNRRRQVVQAALQARGVPEASALLAVETMAGPSRPEAAGTTLPIHVTPRYLDMGQLHPSQPAQASLVVSGGPGTARATLDRIRVDPERFGPQESTLTISVAKMLPEEMILGEVILDSGHETVRVEVSVRWTNQRSDLFGDLLPDGAFQRLGTVRLRHLDDNWMDTEVYADALSPDGKVLASASRDASEPKHLLAGGFYMNPTLGSVQLWDVTTGVRLLHIREHDPNVHPLTFTPDGRFLYEGRYGGSVRFWNVQTLQPSVHCQGLRPEFDEEEEPDLSDLFVRFQDGIRIVAANHKAGNKRRPDTDSGTVVIGDDYHPQVEVWDLELVQLLRKLDTDWQPIHSVRLAGQDRVVLVELAEIQPDDDADEEGTEAVLLVWDLGKDEVIHRVPGGWRNARLSKDGLKLQVKEAGGNKKISLPKSWTVVTPTSAGETPSRQALLAGKALSIVERASNKVVLEAAGHKDWVTAIVPLPDGKHLATASTDGTVQLWNWHTGELVETLVEEPDEKMMALALSPDGRLLAAAGTSGTVSVCDLTQKALESSWLASEKTINALLFFDADTLFVGGDDGSVTAWCISEETAQGDVVSGPVRFDALALTPDRRLVAKSIGGEIVVLDLNAERPEVQHVFRIENETWSLMAVTPNGATVVLPESGRRLRPVHLEGESRVGFQYQSVLRRWNAKSGEQLEDFRLLADSVRAFSLAFSPDGDSLAVGDQEGRVFLLDAHTGVEKQFWMGHQAMVCSVAFLDNRTLASGSADTTILIWRFDPEKTTRAKEVSNLGGDQEPHHREALRLFAKGDS